MYEIILSDGTTISNLSMNGNNFVSSVKLTENDFRNKLSPVTIVDPDGIEEIHEHMVLSQIVNEPYTEGKWYFVLRDLTEYELFKAKITGDIAYLAMMTDVDL